jgi:hypothetical protein
MHADTVRPDAVGGDVIRSQRPRPPASTMRTSTEGGAPIMTDNLASLFEVLAASIAGGVFAVLVIVLG